MSEKRFRVIIWMWWLLLAAVVIVGIRQMTVTGLAFLHSEDVGIDDTNIYFRYAHNLLAGHGFVWNVGGERVEGVSSLLWLVVCVVAVSLTSQPEALLLSVTILLAALSVFGGVATVTYVTLSRRSGCASPVGALIEGGVISAATTGLVLWWIVVNPPYVAWSVLSLMDTGIWGALITTLACATTCYSVSGSAIFRNLSYAAIALLPICRPEGALLAAVGVAIFLVAEWSRGAVTYRSRRFMLRSVSVFALSVCSLYAARWLYFGYPLPNTYYAKVDGDRWFNIAEGWSYLTTFGELYPYPSKATILLVGVSFIALIASFVARLLGARRWQPLTFVFWGGCILAGSFVAVWVGGDHFKWWRFLQPYWVPLFVGLLLFGDRIIPACIPPFLRALIVSSVAAGFLTFQSPRPGVRWEEFRTPFGPEYEFQIASHGRSVGTDLNEIFAQYPSLPVVGALTVGGLGQSYKGPINDLLGLTNVEMAHASTDRRSFIKGHSAFDVGVFLRQRPTFLFLMADYCDLASPQRTLEMHDFYARAMKRIHESPAFQELYVPIVVWNERLRNEGKGLCGYALREELASERATFGF